MSVIQLVLSDTMYQIKCAYSWWRGHNYEIKYDTSRIDKATVFNNSRI